MKKLLTLILVLFINLSFSQEDVENWQTYMASYEGGKLGSTTVRMDLIESAPISGYNYVLVTGITYESERENGFPKGDETFNLLYKIGDDLEALINENVESIMTGSFMHNFQRLEYFYLKSDSGIKEKIEAYYKTNYPNKKYYLNIKEDKNWEYYTEFLYPNEETQNYMSDQSVLMALQNAGDNLTKARHVYHWVYFPNKTNLEAFEKDVKKQAFKVESSGKIDDSNLPYSLQFYRTDKVDIDSIYPITSGLRILAKKHNGSYDGWETSVETD